MGRRSRQRGREELPDAPTTTYADADGNQLILRGALSLKSRQRYTETLRGGHHQDDAWQRATELLFEQLVVSWTINDVVSDRQRELLQRYRVASGAERQFVRDSLRAHVAENFPELEAP